MSDITKRSQQSSVTVLLSIYTVKMKRWARKYHKEWRKFVAGVPQLWSCIVVYVATLQH